MVRRFNHMKIKVLELDSPNKNGRVYPNSVFKKSLYKINNKIRSGEFFVYDKSPENEISGSILNVIGVVNEISIKDYDVYAHVKFNEKYKFFKEKFEEKKFHLRTYGIGTPTLQSDGTFLIGEDYELQGLLLTKDPA